MRRAVELDQVQRLDIQALDRILDKAVQQFGLVARIDVGVDLLAGLGGDDHVLRAARFQHFRDQLFRAAGAIDIRGVDEIDPAIQRLVQRCLGVTLRHIAPIRADRPGAESDRCDLPAGLAENARVHMQSLCGGKEGRHHKGHRQRQGGVELGRSVLVMVGLGPTIHEFRWAGAR
jgi:hypothetical protein